VAVYGSDDVAIIFDNSAGTTVNVSQSILEISGIDLEAVLEESHTFGDSWVEQLFTGLKRGADITVKGFFDDDADTGFDFMFKNIGDGRTFQILYGAAKTTTAEVVIKNYRRMPTRGEITKAEAVLSLNGAVTDA
jgi:hypothetical protein